ncbi:hypothetical protein VC83_02177 [Pseudogymnoascus destructans]|uniref:F-box domain-containing protein n=1 Tax=Pseudogymnoascus destructans TaxID=655981 RepID=A0A177AJ81_9PEZI|nr:uncharacterized protein VC83_02177 [Pseudogymnoascus destructans]OAF61542.1 hypothetical protein VC83_02177 [Pseudogymnoascus destructans]
METTYHKSERLAQHNLQTQPTGPASPFLTLPLELILLTTSYLPIESVGCLSLCCHYLYSLKTEYHLKTKSRVTIDNLQLPKDAFLHSNDRLPPSSRTRPIPPHRLSHCNKLHPTPLAT